MIIAPLHTHRPISRNKEGDAQNGVGKAHKDTDQHIQKSHHHSFFYTILIGFCCWGVGCCGAIVAQWTPSPIYISNRFSSFIFCAGPGDNRIVLGCWQNASSSSSNCKCVIIRVCVVVVVLFGALARLHIIHKREKSSQSSLEPGSSQTHPHGLLHSGDKSFCALLWCSAATRQTHTNDEGVYSRGETANINKVAGNKVRVLCWALPPFFICHFHTAEAHRLLYKKRAPSPLMMSPAASVRFLQIFIKLLGQPSHPSSSLCAMERHCCDFL